MVFENKDEGYDREHLQRDTKGRVDPNVRVMAEAFAHAMDLRDKRKYSEESTNLGCEREEYFRKQRDYEKEKYVIQNIQKYTQGMDLASYIQEFEETMRREDIIKTKWADLLKQVLTGQVWQDWVDHKGDGSSEAYDVCKAVVLELHGESMLSCIKNVFAFKKKGDSFSARLSLARAYRERMLRGARTLKDAQDKIDMWIVLSSYSEDCMAAVLRDNPHSASELATSIHRYMELHPEGGRRTFSQGRGNLYNGNPYQGQSDHYRTPTTYPQKQYHNPQNIGQSNPPRQFHRQYSQNNLKDEHQNYSVRGEQQHMFTCFLCHEQGHKANFCPRKGKSFHQNENPKRNVRRLFQLSPGSKKVSNIVTGCVNGIKTTFMLDSAADMTVVNRNLIREDQLTGDKVTLQGYAPGMSLTFPVACVVIHSSDLSFPMTVATVDILDDNDGGLIGTDVDLDVFQALMIQASQARSQRFALGGSDFKTQKATPTFVSSLILILKNKR